MLRAAVAPCVAKARAAGIPLMVENAPRSMLTLTLHIPCATR